MKYETRKTIATVIEKTEQILFDGMPDMDECRCEKPDPYHKIHHGNLFKEIHAYCLRCGGLIDE
jgi:hypothetical protein